MLDGIAERATTRTGAFTSDRRLTLLEHLWHNRRVALLMAAAIWLIPPIFLGIKALKELRE
ncbi:MAG: hypothetical protein HC897_17750 [Thermoanaerobaculia bacterium]|nr:hypothetical protein [Thermoanaerobaculia bacterium]